jgi:hypothetical protein
MKKVTSYNLSKTNTKNIELKAKADGRKNSDWLDRFLTEKLDEEEGFSLHPDNHAYIEAVVSKQKETNHRYNRSMYMDDLITHLRTKAEAKTELAVIKPKTKKFSKPDLLDIYAYMVSRGVDSEDEANKFNDFYESKGWVVGKVKMKCWKAAARNWLKGYKQKAVNNNILQDSSNSNWHLKEDTGF